MMTDSFDNTLQRHFWTLFKWSSNANCGQDY